MKRAAEIFTESAVAKTAALFFATAAVLLTLAIGSSLYLKSAATQDNCEGVNEVRMALQNILTRSQALATKNPSYSAADKEAASDFYDRAISDLEPKEC